LRIYPEIQAGLYQRFQRTTVFSPVQGFLSQLLLALQTLTQATFHPKIIGVFICNTEESVKYEYNLSPVQGFLSVRSGYLPTGEFKAPTQHRFHFTAIKVFLLPNGSTHQMDCIS
jgi:hypothetical protein